MVQYIEKYKKNIAIDMRKRGMSYSEIENRTHVPKSTLSYWLKNLKLTEEQKKKLNEQRLEAMKRGLEKKTSQRLQMIDQIKITSVKSINKISKRELWLMGIVLYWRERFLSGNESDMREGVRFTSSDPYLIKLFLKWLYEIGDIKNDEIKFNIFIGEKRRNSMNEVIEYWADVTNLSPNFFSSVYFQKERLKKAKRTIKNKTSMGLLRVRVKSSSMLARQIAGWVYGIIKSTKG